jgi:hypothetical protein
MTGTATPASDATVRSRAVDAVRGLGKVGTAREQVREGLG